MSRRYLSKLEVEGAIRRGKQVDAFLGAGNSSENRTIKYLTLRASANQVVAELWEVEDPGDPNYHDVYSLYPPHGDDAPDIIFNFGSVAEAMSQLDLQFPGVASRFMNQGVIDDEYAAYKASGNK